MTLEKLLEHAADFAVAQFNRAGEVSPMFIAETADAHIVIPCLWADRQEKHRTFDALRLAFRAMDVERYATMGEAWTVICHDGKLPASYLAGAGLDTHPDRREIMHVIAADKERALCREWSILRPETGKPTLRPIAVKADSFGGDLASLLRDA